MEFYNIKNRKFKIDIFYREKVSFCRWYVKKRYAKIILNAHSPKDIQDMEYAHELGHIFYDHSANSDNPVERYFEEVQAWKYAKNFLKSSSILSFRKYRNFCLMTYKNRL